VTIKGQIKSLKKKLIVVNLKIKQLHLVDKKDYAEIGYQLGIRQDIINQIDKLKNLKPPSYKKVVIQSVC